MKHVVVSGVIANKHRSAGAIWTRLNWTLGFRKLGFDVFFVEQLAAEASVDWNNQPSPPSESANLATFSAVMSRFGLEENSALLGPDGDILDGLEREDLSEVFSGAEALINISGHLTIDHLLAQVRRKIYIDLDPGFTQIWEATGVCGARLDGHDHFFTIGENIGRPDCPIPSAGRDWQPTRQPVVLDLWPVTGGSRAGAFRTIASWRGPYGPIEFAGQRLGLKAHEWRRFLELPGRTGHRFEIALDIHPADQRDLDALQEHGWKVIDPRSVVGNIDAVQEFIRESAAEFSVAQGVYVGTRSGWVSDRTVCYLASGRPTLVQQTGFSDNHPARGGLVPFETLDDAVASADAIMSDYSGHCALARDIAERDFDSDKVLGELVDRIGVSP